MNETAQLTRSASCGPASKASALQPADDLVHVLGFRVQGLGFRVVLQRINSIASWV